MKMKNIIEKSIYRHTLINFYNYDEISILKFKISKWREFHEGLNKFTCQNLRTVVDACISLLIIMMLIMKYVQPSSNHLFCDKLADIEWKSLQNVLDKNFTINFWSSATQNYRNLFVKFSFSRNPFSIRMQMNVNKYNP